MLKRLPMLLLLLAGWAYVFGLTHPNRLDDFLITARYGYNLAHGQGLTYNPGERVQGFTSPGEALWFALIESLFHPGDNLPPFGPLLGSMALMACAAITIRWMPRRPPQLGLLLALPLFALNELFWADIGMDVLPAAALGLLSIELYSQRRFNWCALTLGGGILMRPDVALLAAILSFHFLLTQRRLPQLTAILIFLAVIAPWFVFAKLYFGAFLPNTLGAKIGQGQAHHALASLGAAWEGMQQWSPLHWLVPLAALGVGWAILTRNTPLLLLSVWSGLHLGAYFIVLRVPSNYHWYLVLPAVGIVSTAAAGVVEIAGWGWSQLKAVPSRIAPSAVRLTSWLGPHGNQIAGVALFLAACAVPTALLTQEPAMRERYNLNPHTFKYEAYWPAAMWLRENTPPEAVVAAGEVGVLGFYSHRPIRDLSNLVNRGVSWDNLDAEYLVVSEKRFHRLPAGAFNRYAALMSFHPTVCPAVYICRRK